MKKKYGEGKYFSWRDTVDDVKYAYGAKEKAVASTKLVGKSAFNIGKFALAEALPGAIKVSAKFAEKVAEETAKKK